MWWRAAAWFTNNYIYNPATGPVTGDDDLDIVAEDA